VGNNLPGINDNVTERGLEQNNGAYCAGHQHENSTGKSLPSSFKYFKGILWNGRSKPRLSIRHASCGKKDSGMSVDRHRRKCFE